jgi:hypothetical protein
MSASRLFDFAVLPSILRRMSPGRPLALWPLGPYLGAMPPRKNIASARKAAKLRSWRVSILRAQAQYRGDVKAPDQRSAEAEAAGQVGLTAGQRRRRGQPSLTNIVRIVSPEWKTWLDRRPKGEESKIRIPRTVGLTKKNGSVEN